MQTKKVAFVRYEFELAIQAIRPTVEFTGEAVRRSVPVPDHLIASMGAHIMKCLELAIFATSDNDRGLANDYLFHTVIAGKRNLLDSTDVQPGFAKNVLTFQSCILIGNIRLDWYRPRA